MFDTEQELVDAFCDLVLSKKQWNIEHIAPEFYYGNGRTDVVAIKGKRVLLGFEAKLYRWRDALSQAYRNSAFCHYSYVVLPQNAAQAALNEGESFLRRGIGLCVVNESMLRLVIKARRNEPLQPWLTKSAAVFLKDSSNGI